MQEVESIPFYSDWTFWAVVIAVFALVLSQLPPVSRLLRRAKIDVKPYDKIYVTDWLGNPNMKLHLLLKNTGGRQVRILSIGLEIKGEDGLPFLLPGQSFTTSDGDSGELLLTQFTIKSGDDWSGLVFFAAIFSSESERHVKKMMKELRSNIREKIKVISNQGQEMNELEADEAVVKPLLKFFRNNHKWKPGQYTMSLVIKCEPDKASVTSNFRFTIFESDETELTERTNRYKIGAGVYYHDSDQYDIYSRIEAVSGT